MSPATNRCVLFKNEGLSDTFHASGVTVALEGTEELQRYQQKTQTNTDTKLMSSVTDDYLPGKHHQQHCSKWWPPRADDELRTQQSLMWHSPVKLHQWCWVHVQPITVYYTCDPCKDQAAWQDYSKATCRKVHRGWWEPILAPTRQTQDMMCLGFFSHCMLSIAPFNISANYGLITWGPMGSTSKVWPTCWPIMAHPAGLCCLRKWAVVP